MDPKAVVRRFVDEAVNAGHDELIDELFAPALTGWAHDWFGSLRRSVPDLRMELVELVGDGDTVVGRFACSATHRGEWRGHAPTGQRFENVDEVYFVLSKASGSSASGRSRTRSTASASSASSRATFS